MRTIHIANEKKRNANVSLESKSQKKRVEYVIPDGSIKKNVTLLKTTLSQNLPSLLDQYGTLDNIAQQIIDSDPEVDLEKTGMILENTRKLYLSQDNKILYGVDLFEISRSPDGEEKERKYYSKNLANVNIDIPVKCSNKLIPKDKAIKMFVFSHKYQIKHVNGLTYDFLFDIAKRLHDANAFMFVGAGQKGMDPLVLYTGGTSYRAFLEGRVKNDTYCLIMHLSNLELKELVS